MTNFLTKRKIFYQIVLTSFVLCLISNAGNSQIANAPCNLSTPWISSSFNNHLSATITDDVPEEIIVVICAGSIGDPNALIDSDLTNSTNIAMTGINCEAELSVVDDTNDYPAGTFAGYKIDPTNLLNINVGATVTVSTYKNSIFQEAKEVVNSSGIDVSLLLDDGTVNVGFVSTLDFDEIRISFDALVGLTFTTEVFYPIIQRFCAGPDIQCNSLEPLSVPTHPLLINNDNTGFDPLVCVGCSLQNPDNIINTNPSDFARITLVGGVLGDASVSVKNQLDTYESGTFTGFDIENTSLLNASILNHITINTFLDGNIQESASGPGSLISTGSSIITDNGRRTIGFITNSDFDEVQFSISNLVGVDLGITDIYSVIFSDFCPIDIECDLSYFLVNDQFPVMINSARTGTQGVACVGSSVQNATNVISPSNSDAATIQVAAGALCTASLSVQDALTTYPAGSTAGFVIDIEDQLFLNIGLQILDHITICTYNDGNLQECKTSGDLINLELLFLFVNNPDGIFNIGFETSMPYDEIQISLGSIVGLLNEVDIFSAFSDTRGATGTGFNCCPTESPDLNANIIENTCPSSTVNLNSLVSETPPVNSELRWYSNNMHTGTQYATPTMATAGTYFGFYYDTENDCFSSSTEAVLVSIEACADLEIEMSVDDPTPDYGQLVVFTLTATNNGTDDETGVVTYDTIPDGYTFVSSLADIGSYNETTHTWTIGNMNNLEMATLELTLLVEGSGNYLNKANIEGDGFDDDLSNNSVSLTTNPIDICVPAGEVGDFDCDDDGLTNNEELTGIDDPIRTPADPDGNITDPDDPDTDGDGVVDGTEPGDSTDPNNPCSFLATSVTLTPEVGLELLDCDGDGVTNGDEVVDMTDPFDACQFILGSVSQNAVNQDDCDGDGVANADEINGLDDDFSTTDDNTNPLDSCDYNPEDQGIPSVAWNMKDCDGDGVPNGQELIDMTSPLDPCSLIQANVSLNAFSLEDCDGDGVTNADEINGTDGDFTTSGDNTDPLDACDFNSTDITLTVTADLSQCNTLFAIDDINITLKNTAVSGNILTNDGDFEDDEITITSVTKSNGSSISMNGLPNSLPEGGQFVINSSGDYGFNPQLGFTGVVSIKYEICDDRIPEVCDLAVLEIKVMPEAMEVNNPPVAINDVGQTPNNVVLSGNVLENDVDPDEDGLMVSTTPVQMPLHGMIVLQSDGSFLYTPDSGYTGNDTMRYEVSDDASSPLADQAMLVIEITAPHSENEVYANDDTGLGWQNQTINIDLLMNDSDPEQDELNMPTLVSNPNFGVMTINANKTVSYTPTADFTGTDKVVYSVCDDAEESVCDTATIYLAVMDKLCFNVGLRVYLEGALVDNDNETGSMSRPLMRDNLRSNSYEDTLGARFIPDTEPYTALQGFNHVGNGGGEVATENAFADRGENSVVDWVFVELRSQNNAASVVATRSAFVQRDGDIVDVDGTSPLEFCELTDLFYYVAIRHRNHLGVMTATFQNLSAAGLVLDFSNWNVGNGNVFDFGTEDPRASSFDYTGLSMKNVKNVGALWSGNANGDNKIKFQAPGDDVFKIFDELLFHSGNPTLDYNYDKGYGYFSGDLNMDGKVKLQAPNDDTFILFDQLLFYPLNDFDYNFDAFYQQLKF